MYTSPESALEAFKNSDYCFDQDCTNKLIAIMSGPVKFAVQSIKFFQSNRRAELIWMSTEGGLNFTINEAHAIATVAETDYESPSSSLHNTRVIFNDRSGLDFSIPELLMYLHLSNEAFGGEHDFFWRILNEYAIERICRDFCLFCLENNIVFDSIYENIPDEKLRLG